MTKISVIVPVYNVEDYLEKCLDSLVNQKYKDFEVIIVNDGSTDNSQDIIDEYVSKYDNFKSFNKKNGGLASARNYGLTKANGEYVLFLDSDDYYELDCLSILANELNDDNIIVFNMFVDYPDRIISDKDRFSSMKIENTKKYLISNPSACNKLFKRELFFKNKIEFPIGKYYEDLGTTPMLTMFTDKIKFIPNNLYHYLKREDSIMNKVKYNSKIEDIFYIVSSISTAFKENNKYDLYKEEIEFIYIHHLLKAGGLRFLNYDKYDMINKIRGIIKDKYPNFTKNRYFKNYDFKEKMMCHLLYGGHYRIIKFLRK